MVAQCAAFLRCDREAETGRCASRSSYASALLGKHGHASSVRKADINSLTMHLDRVHVRFAATGFLSLVSSYLQNGSISVSILVHTSAIVSSEGSLHLATRLSCARVFLLAFLLFQNYYPVNEMCGLCGFTGGSVVVTPVLLN